VADDLNALPGDGSMTPPVDDLAAPAGDELTTPLGRPKKRRRNQLPPYVPQAVAGALGLFLVVFALWAMLADDPFGGEPVVVLAAPKGTTVAAKTEAGPSPDTGKAEAAARPAETPAHPPAANQAGNQTVTIIDGSSGSKQEVMVPSGGTRTAAVDSKLLETTRHGQIPRVGLDGSRPMALYARPPALSPEKAALPRIALVMGGLGIGASSTSEALSKLPAAVTMGFAPYGTDLDRVVSRARGEGHEILLQLPMEPFDYPDNDPGPQTLLTSLSPEQNVDRMHWLMSRFQGYVGVTNYMGARFTATEPALAPVMREAAKRGLLYLDDSSSPRSLAGQIAGANSVPFVKATLVLDAVPNGSEIDRALLRLEALARENGVAVGVASALPVSIERLAQWAKTADSRGFLLVPISMATGKAKAAEEPKSEPKSKT